MEGVRELGVMGNWLNLRLILLFLKGGIK